MVDCEYCSEDFASEEEYLKHLQSSHTREEVSNIDERKIDNQLNGFNTDDREWPVNKIILGSGLLLFIGVITIIAYVTIGGAGPSKFEWVETEPYNGGHYHGEMHVTIDGNELDFSQDKFQVLDEDFHFEANQGTRWHGHAQQITLQYALATLGIEAHQEELTYQGTTYTTENYEIKYLVNGEPVNVSTYELQEGDVIRVQVTEK